MPPWHFQVLTPDPASNFVLGDEWRAQVKALPQHKFEKKSDIPIWDGYPAVVCGELIGELIVATHMDLAKRIDPNAQAQKASEAASAAQAAAAQAAAAAELTVAAKPLLDKLDAMESRLSRLDKLDAIETRLKTIEENSCCVVS